MSNEARNRDIAALLARGVIRVKKQPLVARAIESRMPLEQDASNLTQNRVNNDLPVSKAESSDGGDQ